MASPRSIQDVVDNLATEFGGTVPTSVITEIVLRLSRNGAVTLPTLAALAHRELSTDGSGNDAP